MKYLIIIFAISLSFSATAVCVSGFSQNELANMDQENLGSNATLISDVTDCSDNTLALLRSALEKDVAGYSKHVQDIYDNIVPAEVAQRTFGNNSKILVNREAIKLSRRHASLALVKSEINERKIRKLVVSPSN